jgi:hypothetical protein
MSAAYGNWSHGNFQKTLAKEVIHRDKETEVFDLYLVRYSKSVLFKNKGECLSISFPLLNFFELRLPRGSVYPARECGMNELSLLMFRDYRPAHGPLSLSVGCTSTNLCAPVGTRYLATLFS